MLLQNVWAQRVFDEEEGKNGRGTYSWSNGNCYEGRILTDANPLGQPKTEPAFFLKESGRTITGTAVVA